MTILDCEPFDKRAAIEGKCGRDTCAPSLSCRLPGAIAIRRTLVAEYRPTRSTGRRGGPALDSGRCDCHAAVRSNYRRCLRRRSAAPRHDKQANFAPSDSCVTIVIVTDADAIPVGRPARCAAPTPPRPGSHQYRRPQHKIRFTITALIHLPGNVVGAHQVPAYQQWGAVAHPEGVGDLGRRGGLDEDAPGGLRYDW